MAAENRRRGHASAKVAADVRRDDLALRDDMRTQNDLRREGVRGETRWGIVEEHLEDIEVNVRASYTFRKEHEAKAHAPWTIDLHAAARRSYLGRLVHLARRPSRGTVEERRDGQERGVND